MVKVLALAIAATTLVGGQPSRSRTLIVSVVNQAGAVETGLTDRDFSVEISGKPATTVDVSPAAGPLSVMLLFDRSASVQSVPLDPASPFASGGRHTLLDSETVSGAMLRQRQPSDREYFGRFSGFTEFRGPVAPDATAWHEVLTWGLARVPGSSSPIWDAAADAARRLERDQGRKLLVLVTDGRSNGNVLSLEDAALQIVRSGVAVSVIDIGYREQLRQEDQLVAVPRPDRLLTWLAEATGGHYVHEPKMLKTRIITADLLGNLVDLHRRAYSIRVDVPAYLPSPQSVKVTVKRPGATARAAAFVEVR